jgi:anti-sigma factor RsiW
LNAIGEFELQLLEDYLDDALSPAQVEHVARRVSDEPEMALAMHELRAARVLRAAAWRALEPTAAHAVDVASGVTKAVRRAERIRRRRWVARVGSGIAAAVAVFVIGWLLRGPAGATAPRSQQQGRQIVPEPIGSQVAVVRPPPAAAAFHVALLDSQGNVIPIQKFSKAEEARQFAQDLMTYEDRRHEARQGGAMLVSDRF